MKKYIIVFLFLIISFSVFSATSKADIMTMLSRLKNNGVSNINLVYDWGDGNKEIIAADKFEDAPRHFYEKEGNFKITLSIQFTFKGKTHLKTIETRDFDYKIKPLKYNLKENIPHNISQDKPVMFKALFSLKNTSLKVKNIKYSWFFDDILDQYDEGQRVFHTFKIPCGDKKPYYTVTLRISLKYQKSGDNFWLPFSIVKKYKVKVSQTSRLILSQWTKKIKLKNGRFSQPFFMVFHDKNVNRSDEFYKKSRLLYHPVVFTPYGAYPTSVVTVKRSTPTRPPYKAEDFYTEIVFMIDLDKTDYIQKTNKKNTINLLIKVNDIFGLISKKVSLNIETK